jgi:hypothetical protein
MGIEETNKSTVESMTQAVVLTPTKWEILTNAQTVRLTATGSDGKTYSVVLPTIHRCTSSPSA